jgi:hypothetical protein
VPHTRLLALRHTLHLVVRAPAVIKEGRLDPEPPRSQGLYL